jgi:hypothetical protein
MIRPTFALTPLLAACTLAVAAFGEHMLMVGRNRARLRRATAGLDARLLADVGLPADCTEPRLARPFWWLWR